MRLNTLVLASASLLLAACASSGTSGSASTGAKARADIESRSGSTTTGTATFTEVKGGVRVVVDVSGTTPGEHAVHLHEKGDCSAPDGASAGGHFNPASVQHGAPTADPHHAGDFGNMTVGADGKGHIDLTTDKLTVAPGPNSVMGRGIIVHAKVDDFQTQPTGNAGGRVACGVVR